MASYSQNSRLKLVRRKAFFESLEFRQLMATLTWDGGGANNRWDNALNWMGDVVPQTGDDLVFDSSVAGLTRFTATNQVNEFQAHSITIRDDSGTHPFTLDGSSVKFQSGGDVVINQSGGSTIQMPLVLTAASTYKNVAGNPVFLGTVANAGFDFTINTVSSDAISFFGQISGSGGLVKSGIGTAHLSANTYTGLTNIQAGSIFTGALESLGSTAQGTTIAPGARLDLGAGTADPINLGGTLTGFSSATASGNILLTASTAKIAAVDNFVVSGRIRDLNDTYDLTLSSSGVGALSLTGNSSDYSGTTFITGGTVSLGNGDALPNEGVVQVNAGATLNLTTSELIGALAGVGNVTTGPFGISLNATVDAVFSGVLSGPAGVNKQGAGKQTFSGLNTYTGATWISGGVLEVNKLADGGVASSLGAASNSAHNLHFYGGTLRYIGAGDSTDRLFGVSNQNGTIINASPSNGTLNFTNTDPIGNGNNNGPRQLVLSSSGGTISLAASIGDFGGATTLATTGGTIVLTGNNTYTGATTIGANTTLQIGANGTGGTLGSGTVSDAGTLVFHRSDNLVVNQQIVGAGGVAKRGNGAVTLANTNNSYAGPTVIEGEC